MPRAKKARDRTHYSVWGILAEFPEKTEPISNARFMEEMRKIKRRNPKLFPGLIFSENSSNTWSYVLEHSLFCLGVAGCLRRSPVDRRWYLHGVTEGFQREFARYFTEKELLVLQREGKTLAAKVARGELAPEWAKV
jgi:hypothetical protein